MSSRLLRALVLSAALCAAGPAFAAPAGPAEQLIAQGDALAGAGRFADAEPVFRRAAVAAEAAYGPNDPRTLTALGRVGLILKELGSYAGAEVVLRDVLAREEAGSDPGRKALALSNLAQNLGGQKRYAEAEATQRRAIEQAEAAGGPNGPYAASYVLTLGEIFDLQDRAAEAEGAYRTALAVYERQPGGPPVRLLLDLGRNLAGQNRPAEAEPLLRRALASAEAARPQRPEQLGQALNRLGQVILDRGRQRDAIELFQRRIALLQANPSQDVRDVPVAQYNLGLALLAGGRFQEAEALQRQAAAGFERIGGQASAEVVSALRGLAASAMSQGRYGEGERLSRRALDLYRPLPEATPLGVAQIQNGIGLALFSQGQVVGAEAVQREAIAALEGAVPPDSPTLADPLNDLSATLVAAGKLEEAEALQRRALAIAEKDGDRRDRWVAKYAAGLAAVLQAQDRPTEAEPLLRRAVDINQRRLGRDHLVTAVARENLSFALYNTGRFEAASRSFRGGCRREVKAASKAVRQSPSGVLGSRTGMGAAACSGFQAAALWGWAQAGGGTQVEDRPDALMAEAFLAAQRAQAATPGQGLSLAAARRSAIAAGAGQDAADYEALLAAREQIDAQALEISPEPGAGDQRQALAELRAKVDVAIPALEKRLSETHSRYWALRSPQPVSLAALHAKTGRDAVLLKADEALVVLLIPEKGAKGLVFAVSKDKAAWAQIPLTGEDIRVRVDKLRNQIDARGYTIRADRQAAPGEPLPSFDRQGAYELYQALFGSAAIQAVLKDKPSWLISASGAMNSLPPSLLVTEAPKGGVAGDSDPAALRATAWLVRAKATTILPGVASLRLMRQEPTRQTAKAEEPLLAFADPDFAGRFAAMRSTELFPAERYFSDGGARAEQLASLPPLPGTRVEGLRLLQVLGGKQDGLLVGPDATETALRQRNASGRLAQAQVIEFATHGLVWGDFDVSEPSLALAFPAPGSDLVDDDGLLTSSEAAGLKLNADWVILSACNTAGPNGSHGDGLSGLASAFLFAGSRSVLATHWPVRDDVPPVMIPLMLKVLKDHPEMSRAQALQAATLAVLDTPQMQAYYPGAWAPFVLLGEGG